VIQIVFQTVIKTGADSEGYKAVSSLY